MSYILLCAGVAAWACERSHAGRWSWPRYTVTALAILAAGTLFGVAMAVSS